MAFNLFDWLAEAGEDIGDFLSSPVLTIPRRQAKTYAAQYHLGNDAEAFEELWGLTIQSLLFAQVAHDAAQAEVDRELDLLRQVADRAPSTPTRFGHPVRVVDDDGYREMQVASTTGRYAIFSDHHMLFTGNRQNFFRAGSGGNTGNRDLYVEVLSRYYAAESYTLVENGDVEELIILEPVLSEIDNIGSWGWDRVARYRESKKLPQLRAIVRDNLTYYHAIADGFIRNGRYFRLTGNHDRDMREQRFADTVSEAAGITMPLASDVLVLRGTGGVDYIICHGHQFDTSCTPAFAMQLGESYSQASAWAYQGPDRVWRSGFDPIDEWLSGRRSFSNMLVVDQPAVSDRGDLPLVGKTPAELAALATSAADGLVRDMERLVGNLIGDLTTARQWENIYDKNIAWEYFDNRSATTAIHEEVATGKRWFKFRHMNEQKIVDRLRAAFAGTPRVPTLVLGHSHEPRFRAGHPGQGGAVAACYLNTASAGRFENLLWGVELIDGEPFMISWHRATPGGEPIRTIWIDALENGRTVLKPQSASPLPDLLSAPVRSSVALQIAIDHVL